MLERRDEEEEQKEDRERSEVPRDDASDYNLPFTD
jgi:hypothetical protein